jgi:peptide/nickel transport system permease protein
MSIIVGTMVIFAYLFGLTMLLLDIAYVIVDPRLRIGGNAGTLHLAKRQPIRPSFWRKSRERLLPAVPHLKPPADPTSRLKRTISNGKVRLRASWNSFKSFAQELRRYPSAIFGLGLVAMLVAVSIYTIFALPYRQIGRDWFMSSMIPRPTVPKLALPEWVNIFRRTDLPPTIILDSRTGDAQKVIGPQSGEIKNITLTYFLDYPYTEFPKDLVIYYYPRYEQKVPFASVTITTPDGRVFELRGVAATAVTDYEPGSSVRPAKAVAENKNWQKWFVVSGLYPTPSFYILFADPEADSPKAVAGTYKVQIHVMTFEEGADLDAQLVVFGQVYGAAGTDYLRRDLMIPLLWGMPIALLFGLFGAIAITIASALVGAAAAWYSGWVDGLLQRVIEANMILPVLAIGILFYAYYRVNIWLILTVVVLLNIFGSPAKTFRAAFLQIKEAPYVEAARAYGASNWRIIWRYLIPRITPVMLPQLIALIPSFAFLEATFAIFNVSDATYPTWGLVIQTALRSGATFWYGSRFWVFEPIALILLTGMAFGMSGAAFDKILNPRLRTK